MSNTLNRAYAALEAVRADVYKAAQAIEVANDLCKAANAALIAARDEVKNAACDDDRDADRYAARKHDLEADRDDADRDANWVDPNETMGE